MADRNTYNVTISCSARDGMDAKVKETIGGAYERYFYDSSIALENGYKDLVYAKMPKNMAYVLMEIVEHSPEMSAQIKLDQ